MHGCMHEMLITDTQHDTVHQKEVQRRNILQYGLAQRQDKELLFLIELGSKSPYGEGKITFRPLLGKSRRMQLDLLVANQQYSTVQNNCQSFFSDVFIIFIHDQKCAGNP